jgi:hypothetical protein
MAVALQLTATREAKLCREAGAAIAATSSDELKAWAGRTIRVLGEVTTRRGKNFGTLLSSIWGFLGDEGKGLLAAIRNRKTLPHLQGRASAAVARAQTFHRDLAALYDVLNSNLKNRPKETAPKLIAGVLGFFVGSGGVDGDGGVPDLDLLAGIGVHRSIFTHSIVSGIVVETLILSVLDLSKTVYRNLPEQHDPLWEDLNLASDEVLGSLTKGFSFGIAYHLGVDATVDGDGTYKDLVASIPEGGHQSMLIANAIAEGFDAGKRDSEPTINEIEGRLFKNFQEAASYAKRDTSWTIVRATDAQGFRLVRKVPKQTKPPLTARSRPTRNGGARPQRGR